MKDNEEDSRMKGEPRPGDPTATHPGLISEYPRVLLAHGGGGRLTQALIEKFFIPTFDNAMLDARHDGAVFELGGRRFALTTDSYVVKPLFFPGGDIGSLAVHGTVNDLAMCGARPLFLTVGMVLEEGLPMATLWRVTRSLQAAAADAGVQIVTGDTKVVDRGKGDQLFLNTSGIGVVETPEPPCPARILPGDAVILSGDIGRHGMAVMAAREGFRFEHDIESDSAPLNKIVMDVLDSPAAVHCLRDLTRGGLAGALVEIAETASLQIDVDESAVPVRDDVRAACEILGLDPMYVANEGRFVAFVPGGDAEDALAAIRRNPLGRGAVVIGRVAEGKAGVVTSKTGIGTTRLIDMLSGEQLPRIC